jgi:hypothetical protein
MFCDWCVVQETNMLVWGGGWEGGGIHTLHLECMNFLMIMLLNRI